MKTAFEIPEVLSLYFDKESRKITIRAVGGMTVRIEYLDGTAFETNIIPKKKS